MLTNTNRFLVLLGLSWGIQQTTIAQDAHIASVATTETTYVASSTASPNNAKKIAPYMRHHKQMPSAYQGYCIELMTSQMPLRRDNPLFKQFGNVHYELLPDGNYAYNILIDFSNFKAIEEYYKIVILPRVPQAKIVAYRAGKRLLIQQ